MTSTGHYYVYKEGQLFGDFRSGHPVSPVAKPHMHIGKSFWIWDGIFQRLWNYMLRWDASLEACPWNKPDQVGEPVDLSFDPKDGATLIVNNLGGLRSATDHPIMRWENVGTDQGKNMDLIVKVFWSVCACLQENQKARSGGETIHGNSYDALN